MQNKRLFLISIWILTTLACSLIRTGLAPAAPKPIAESKSPGRLSKETFTSVPTLTASVIPSETFTPSPTESPTQTPIPTVGSLNAKVTAEKLSCRYGPGAEYLYLYALNQSANIKLIGRTDANDWLWVDGTNKCWVNAKFLVITGNPKLLPIVYPDIAKLPESPYYPGPSWAQAKRDGNNVEITWEAVPISPGKYADEFMHQYIIEVWRCEGGRIIFETLGTNFPKIIVENDETGCSIPSHGFVYVQEKHGYGGPVEIPWPSR